MKSLIASLLLLVSLGLAGQIIAQEPSEMPKPTAEHKWLHKFLGTWDSQATAKMGPEQQEMKCTAAIVSKTLGEFWIVNEMKGESFGSPMNAIQTIGYDPNLKKYVGTWVDSENSFMWKYEGTVDASGKILTLEAEGPNFIGDPKTMTKFHDIYEFRSDDEIIVTSKILGGDGKWVTFMTGTSKKKK